MPKQIHRGPNSAQQSTQPEDLAVTTTLELAKKSEKTIKILISLALGALAILAGIAITAGILILKNIIPIKNPLAQKIISITIVAIGALVLSGTLMTGTATCCCISDKCILRNFIIPCFYKEAYEQNSNPEQEVLDFIEKLKENV